MSYLISEHYTNGLNINILNLISLFSIFCAISVIINKNPIVSLLFLIGLFANISGYLIMVGLTFIGLSYLIVYIGAVSILFLFILMLINIRISELDSNTRNSLLLAIITVILFNSSFFQVLPYNTKILNNNIYINPFNATLNLFLDSNKEINSEDIYYVTSVM
jgi:NADH-ubiquinone oxidoreductase chain 6